MQENSLTGPRSPEPSESLPSPNNAARGAPVDALQGLGHPPAWLSKATSRLRLSLVSLNSAWIYCLGKKVMEESNTKPQKCGAAGSISSPSLPPESSLWLRRLRVGPVNWTGSRNHIHFMLDVRRPLTEAENFGSENDLEPQGLPTCPSLAPARLASKGSGHALLLEKLPAFKPETASQQ